MKAKCHVIFNTAQNKQKLINKAFAPNKKPYGLTKKEFSWWKPNCLACQKLLKREKKKKKREENIGTRYPKCLKFENLETKRAYPKTGPSAWASIDLVFKYCTASWESRHETVHQSCAFCLDKSALPHFSTIPLRLEQTDHLQREPFVQPHNASWSSEQHEAREIQHLFWISGTELKQLSWSWVHEQSIPQKAAIQEQTIWKLLWFSRTVYVTEERWNGRFHSGTLSSKQTQKDAV